MTGAITGAVNGISAIQNGFGAVSISTSGPVIGKAGRGIFVEESATGSGDILINGSGSVTGTGIGFSGIVAENLDATSNGNITVSQTGNVSGGHDAIRVQANGTGNIIVATGANANITGTSLYGIETQSNGAGSITVTTASGDVITSAGAGINAYNHATAIPQTGGLTTSTMSVSAGGIINSGVVLNGNSSRPAGILVGYQGGPTNNINPNVFGNVTVDNFATINAAGGDGIRAYNFGSGNVSVIDHANTTIAAPDVFGIVAQTDGAGNTSVTTSAGDIINSGSAGILSINSAAAASANSTVSVTANGTINSGVHLTPGGSQPYAIGAGYNGANGTPNAAINGSVSIDNFANLTAAAGWGIDAFNVGNGSITLTDEASTTVSGAQYGIAAYSLGPGSAAVTGGVTISVGSNATIIAGALYGLAGINAVENNAGSIQITTSGGDQIQSGGTGILAGNFATSTSLNPSSNIKITTASGNINSGFDLSSGGGTPGGIWAGYGAGSVNTGVQGSVIVDDSAAINAASGVGIGLYNWGTGNLTAIIESSTPVTAPSIGVSAFAQGGGSVTVTNNGAITAANGAGILAGTGTSTTGVVSVTNSVLPATTASITALGSAATPVIQINNGSTQTASFTNNGTVTASLFGRSPTNMAIGVSNGGSTITNTGTITGNVSLGATTFNNNSGAFWNLNGFNSFGLGSMINNNSGGTINISGVGTLSSGGALTLANNGAVNVAASSAAIIRATVSIAGSFSIGNRSYLDFAGSVGAGTVSFAGPGVLTLDSPTAFNPTISGFSVGDTIDLLGGFIIASAALTNSNTILTVTDTSGLKTTVNYQLTAVQAGTTLDVLAADKIIAVQGTPVFETDNTQHTFSISAPTTYVLGAANDLTARDTISGSGSGFVVSASDTSSADTYSVTINQPSSITVTGNGAGVSVTTSGADIAVINAGSITSGSSATGGVGISTGSGAGSTDIMDYGNVSGGQYAIAASTTTGVLNIVLGGGVFLTSSTSYGIYAITTSGAIDVTALPGTPITINSGSAGILAQDQWAGSAGTGNSISIVNSAIINSGIQPIEIRRRRHRTHPRVGRYPGGHSQRDERDTKPQHRWRRQRQRSW